MKNNRIKTVLLSFILFLAWLPLWAQNSPGTGFGNRSDVQTFIQMMVKQYGFNAQDLTRLFNEVQEQPSVLSGISVTKEQLPWYRYRDIFLTPARIDEGVQFWQAHQKTLDAVSQKDGVDPAVIVAIIGVETYYGKKQGTYRVIDSLSTLAFDYPARAPFFREELKEYLLLTRENNINPLLLKGSYAGAMGQPQFMPSSYRQYAVSYNNNPKTPQKDLANNPNDVIASVSNYFKQHGWQAQQPIATPAQVKGKAYRLLPDNQLKPSITAQKLITYGIKPSQPLVNKGPFSFLMLTMDNNASDYWIGYYNFYVISRYNPRLNYAMAVFQLSQAIREAKKQISPYP